MYLYRLTFVDIFYCLDLFRYNDLFFVIEGCSDTIFGLSLHTPSSKKEADHEIENSIAAKHKNKGANFVRPPRS